MSRQFIFLSEGPRMGLNRHIPIKPDDLEQFRAASETEAIEHSGWSRQVHDHEASRRSAGEEPADDGFEAFVPRWWPSYPTQPRHS